MKLIFDEEFLKLKKWKKIKGYKIDMEFLSDYNHLDIVFFQSTDEFIEKCDYWVDEEGERAFEDIDELLEQCYEEYLDNEGNLYDEPVQDI